MRKILILRGGALGDLIVTLPLFARLRAAWPRARIDLVGNATAAQLALEAGLVDEVHSQHEARWASLYIPGKVPLDFGHWLASFDLVLSFWPDPDSDLANIFPLHAGQRWLSRAALPPAGPGAGPAAAHYSAIVDPLALPAVPLLYRLAEPVPGAHRIALHAGSGSPKKNWPAARWRALAAGLEREFPGELLHITGPAEDAAAGAGAEGSERLASLPLPALAQRLRECRLYIGHDSGVSHLAAACGVPCILLFGPTDPRIWAPPAECVRVIYSDSGLVTISVDAVREAVTSALAAR